MAVSVSFIRSAVLRLADFLVRFSEHFLSHQATKPSQSVYLIFVTDLLAPFLSLHTYDGRQFMEG